MFATYGVTGERDPKAEEATLMEKVRRDWIPKLIARDDLEVVVPAD